MSLANHGKIIIASDMETVIEMANISAPEHLEVATKEPLLCCLICVMPVRSLGAYSPGFGDYGGTEPHSAHRRYRPFLLSSECGDVYEENKYHCLYAGRLDCCGQ